MSDSTRVTVSRSYLDSLRRRVRQCKKLRDERDRLDPGPERDAAQQRHVDALADLRVVAEMVVESADERRSA